MARAAFHQRPNHMPEHAERPREVDVDDALQRLDVGIAGGHRLVGAGT